MRMKVGAFELRKSGASRYDLRDPYHIAVTASWSGFFVGLVIAFVLINLIFALLYLAIPGAVRNLHTITDAFFFSIETLATVGYGAMAPGTVYGHLVSGLEIITGMAFTAITTGLIFVRFSRPRARILYADAAVVTVRNGMPTLMIRIGNARASILTNGNARLSALMIEHTLEGQTYRRPRDLKLERAHLPLFALTWTLMHAIDDESPLKGYDAERMAAEQVRLFLATDAHDTALNADVQDMHDFGPEAVLWDVRYQDAIVFDANGQTFADLARISLVEPDPHSAKAPPPLDTAEIEPARAAQ
jgi:inward rectifier potassium channel